MNERAVKVWDWIAAVHEGDGPVSIAALCRAAVLALGVDGASVTAAGGAVAREPLFASDLVSARLEELQFTLGEGPGTDEFRLGSPTLIPDLASAAARWPGFVPAAVAAGARAIFSFPLQAGAIGVGALSLYRAKPGSLAAEELADVLVFADVALRLMLDASSGVTGSPGYRPLDGLSDARAEVHQATGMISVQLGVSLEEAFVRLRARAFASNAALADVAGAVVNRELRFDSGPVPEPDPGAK
jgi:hypothetical protein